MEWLGRYSMTDVMVLALMIFYMNSSGYTEAVVMPGVYFFAASALITMLAYGWANTVPARPAGLDAQRVAAPIATPPPAGAVVTLPTNPGRRHRPLSKGGSFGAAGRRCGAAVGEFALAAAVASSRYVVAAAETTWRRRFPRLKRQRPLTCRGLCTCKSASPGWRE